MIGLWFQAVQEMKAFAEGVEKVQTDSTEGTVSAKSVTRSKVLVLTMGLVCIFTVPLLKIATGLPPYMGMLLALGVLWFVTDTITFKSLAKLETDQTRPQAVDDQTPHSPRLSILGRKV